MTVATGVHDETLERSRHFWNDKARENPYWYISSALDYEAPDVAGFWSSGAMIWRDLKRASGYAPSSRHAVLEIGCGIGRLSRVIAPEVGRLRSVDISQEMLACARAENPHLSFAAIDGASLNDYGDGTFDLVVAYCVWQHLPSPEVFRQCVSESHRVLRPGGRLIFTYSHRKMVDVFRPLIRARARLREVLYGGPKGLYRHEWLGIRLTRAQAMDACRSAGFIRMTGGPIGGGRDLISAVKASPARLRRSPGHATPASTPFPMGSWAMRR